MRTVKEIYEALFAQAPTYMKYDWDHVGLLCGRWDMPVTKVMVALDPMPDVLEEAKEVGAQLIVTHHPLIFQPITAVTDDTLTGRSLLYLIENGMAAINLHTNLDCAPDGVNDILAKKIGLQNISVIDPVGKDEQGREYGLLRMGMVEPTALADFAAKTAKALGCIGMRYADGGKAVCRVAVGGGSCGSELDAAIKAGCDTFVTADLKYNHFEEAKYHGINLIDAGHFATENPVCERLSEILREAFPELEIFRSKNHRDETQFLING